MFVTPVGFLALALVGVVPRAPAVRGPSRSACWSLGHWAFLLILRALPHTPGHDGVRQFLPAFGVLALVAGLGAASVCRAVRPRAGRPLIVAALVEGAVSVALMMPVPLSYYSPLVGGLPGAARLGMEPTYYWDALTDDALDWLNATRRERQGPVRHLSDVVALPPRHRPAARAASCRPTRAPWPGTWCRTVRGHSGRSTAPWSSTAVPPMSSRSWAFPCSGSSPTPSSSGSLAPDDGRISSGEPSIGVGVGLEAIEIMRSRRAMVMRVAPWSCQRTRPWRSTRIRVG